MHRPIINKTNGTIKGDLVLWDNGGSRIKKGTVGNKKGGGDKKEGGDKVVFFGGTGYIYYFLNGKQMKMRVKLGMLVKRFYKNVRNCFILLMLKNYWYKTSTPPVVIFKLSEE
eukprot:122177_1